MKTQLSFLSLIICVIIFAGCNKEKSENNISVDNRKKIMHLAMDYYFQGDYSEKTFQSFPGFEEILSQRKPSSEIMSINSDSCPVVIRTFNDDGDALDILDYGTGCERAGKFFAGKIEYIFKPDSLGNYSYGTMIDYQYGKFKRNGQMVLYYPHIKGDEPERRILSAIFQTEYEDRGEAREETSYVATILRDSVSGRIQTTYEVFDDIFFKDEDGNDIHWITYTVDEPLVGINSCMTIVSGVLHIKLTDGTYIGNINYGNGSCDDKATYTVNGETKTIELY